ncbi:hypothetical protein OIU79_004704 [Salix purpurea]|uniref:Uncharacterized protein n=1 Tax=Salix purpurea TaxID=77065 RepID=A0A9Q0UB07_SALPP|nr:hypothetical protein OIU79_004704 [Salix purpurea]
MCLTSLWGAGFPINYYPTFATHHKRNLNHKKLCTEAPTLFFIQTDNHTSPTPQKKRGEKPKWRI